MASNIEVMTAIIELMIEPTRSEMPESAEDIATGMVVPVESAEFVVVVEGGR